MLGAVLPVLSQPSPIPHPGKSPVHVVPSFVANVTKVTGHTMFPPIKEFSTWKGKHWASVVSGSYLTISDNYVDLNIFNDSVGGFYQWQVQDWNQNGTSYCIGPWHRAAKSAKEFIAQPQIPAIAIDHGMESHVGRDGRTNVSARHFSWNQTDVPSACALEKTDIWLVPVKMDAADESNGTAAVQHWAPLEMINDDSGCDWGVDLIKTTWTAFRPFDRAKDSKAFALPSGCTPEAPLCQHVCSGGQKCVIDGSDDPHQAYCPCQDIAYCSEWAK